MADSRPYIMIIETDRAHCSTLAQPFDEAGFEVREETRSGQGVAGVMERDPGIVLMAAEMPPLDGVELLPLLCRLTKAPIIVMGEGGDSSVVDALLQGADVYMTRPLKHRELLARVRALMRRSESETRDSPFHHSQISNQSVRSPRARRGLHAIDSRWVRYLFRQSRRMATSRQLVTS